MNYGQYETSHDYTYNRNRELKCTHVYGNMELPTMGGSFTTSV